MNRINVVLLFIVGIISALIFNLLQVKLSNNYILLIIFVFGFVASSIMRFFLKGGLILIIIGICSTNR